MKRNTIVVLGLGTLLGIGFLVSLAEGGEDCSARCKQSGACVPKDGMCVPTKPEHCKSSEDCRLMANCTLGEFGGRLACLIGSDADCRQSKQCKEYGKCTKFKSTRSYACVPGSVADCKQSQGCKKAGRCRVRDPGGGNGACVDKKGDDGNMGDL
jgi:hypothetical protein